MLNGYLVKCITKPWDNLFTKTKERFHECVQCAYALLHNVVTVNIFLREIIENVPTMSYKTIYNSF